VKNLARSLAFIASGFVTAATIQQVIGTAYTIAFFIAVGVLALTDEREAK
jgi:dolichol kinase